ncbi:MAG: nucleotide exchange factor GrpE [Lachnospiraceae bacterium]|nr:nucleotide exchange factor GrpE [Lachnospiraceae bacterium]
MASKKKNGKSKADSKKVNEEILNEPVKEEAEETKEEVKEETAAEEANTEAPETEEASPAEEKKTKEQEKIEELEDRVKRQLAEFENFRKRTDKEKEQMFETGAKSVLEKILPVVDNFERGLSNIKPEEESDPHVEGMRMIYKQLMTELEKLEVKPIEAVGCEFNPDYHNAIMQVASEEYESGFVAQELQKGYMYRDSVLRHSMVAVVP